MAEYQGRKCLLLDGGAATLKDFEMRDGVIDVDVATPASRGFFGIQFRIADDGGDAEWVYLRQHKSGLPDAMQYTPVLHTGLNWQIYNGPGFTGRGRYPEGRLVPPASGGGGRAGEALRQGHGEARARDDDLKSGVQKGQVALAVLTGATYFSNFEVRTTPDAPWERHLPPMPPGTLTQVEPLACATTRSRATSERPLPAVRERRHRRGRTSRRSRPASWSSIAIATRRIRGSRSRTTSRSAWSRSRA